jgi:hypothetical protein
MSETDIRRFQSLLTGDLTPQERRYLGQPLEQERSAMKLLYDCTTESDRGARDFSNTVRIAVDNAVTGSRVCHVA